MSIFHLSDYRLGVLARFVLASARRTRVALRRGTDGRRRGRRQNSPKVLRKQRGPASSRSNPQAQEFCGAVCAGCRRSSNATDCTADEVKDARSPERQHRPRCPEGRDDADHQNCLQAGAGRSAINARSLQTGRGRVFGPERTLTTENARPDRPASKKGPGRRRRRGRAGQTRRASGHQSPNRGSPLPQWDREQEEPGDTQGELKAATEVQGQRAGRPLRGRGPKQGRGPAPGGGEKPPPIPRRHRKSRDALQKVRGARMPRWNQAAKDLQEGHLFQGVEQREGGTRRDCASWRTKLTPLAGQHRR